MVTRRLLSCAGVVLALAIARDAHADAPTTTNEGAATSEGAAPKRPALHHAPRTTVFVGSDIALGAVIERPDQVKRALLYYRAAEGAAEIEFQRSSDEHLPYVAVIPASVVRPSGLAYAIELETTDGARVPVFATRDAPFPVTVLDAPADARAAATLARLGGRRSVVATRGEYVHFGTTEADVLIPSAPGVPLTTERRRVADRYFQIEGSYTYRLLGVVSEFGIRAGVVRGRSLVRGETDPSKYDVGLNYGAPRIRLRASDALHFEGELLTSVTEVGFSGGAGGAVLFGDPYGSHVTFGVEGVPDFGTRGYSRVDLVANRRLVLSPIIEVTDMPHADRAGVRLLGEVGVDLGQGFHANVRGGYQARTFDQGGPTLGGGLAYAF
ncbi:MAG: hypothetical protein U0235_32745 [Polyangiaceae bacterium]